MIDPVMRALESFPAFLSSETLRRKDGTVVLASG
jgi:hypothetical protein